MLPADRYLAHVLGLTEDEFRFFQQEARRRAAAGPQPSVVAGIDPFTWAIISVVATLISVGLSIAASFFKPQTPNPARLQAKSSQGDSTSDNRRYAPRYAFDATQDLAQPGSIIPLIYANRENLSGEFYGGVRVNTTMLWSQIQSFGGNQLLRAIFLLGEGPLAAIDVNNFAIGGNVIGGYDFGNNTANASGSRAAIYARINGALTTRLNASHHIFGRDPSTDPGNAIVDGAADIYQINWSGTYKAAFSGAGKPANQTTFGLYSTIGNNMNFRMNPQIRPIVQAQLVPKGKKGDAKVVCDVDDVASSQRTKMAANWSTRSGVTASAVGSINGTLTYILHPSSDVLTTFSRAVSLDTWTITKEQFADGTAGGSTGFSSSVNQVLAQYKYTNREASGVDLTPLVTVTLSASGLNTTNSPFVISGVTVNPGRGYITFSVVFNTASFESTYGSNETVIEQLMGTSFRIIFDTALIDGDNNKEEEVEYIFKPRFSRTSSQETNYLYSPTYTELTATNTAGALVWEAASTSVTETQTFDANNAHSENSTDTASTIVGWQKTWDDAIIEGELYKAGSALVVCTSRTEEVFTSDADFFPVVAAQGQQVTATFTTVRAGTCYLADPSNPTGAITANSPGSGWTRYCATNWTHLYRCAIANISTTRACKVIEIGFKSSMGIRIQNLCNFRSALSFSQTDDRACLSRKGDTIRRGSTLKVDSHQSGTMTAVEERYSFFRIFYRAAGSGAAFTALTNCYGIRGSTQQAQMNALKLVMPATQQWELRIEPLSGWEIRSSAATGALHVLDGRMGVVTTADGALSLEFRGELNIPRTQTQFNLASTQRSTSIGIPYVDGTSYLDSWGKLAEAFVYEEVSASTQGPEHEIVYINEILSNDTTPLYNGLAILGLNMRSAAEWQNFSQFSSYVSGGLQCRRLLNSLSAGATHLFPDILLDLLTNTTYGRGDIVTDAMIDLASFTEAATWCNTKRYFFDGVIAGLVNIRQWAADVAAANLLIFGESAGRFYLRQAVPSGPAPIRALFTAGNIEEGSFKVQFLDPEEREPIRVSVRYREERASTDLANPGLFPLEREVLVREASGAADDRVETLDLSDYCTSKAHAVDAAKYVIRMRRLGDHAVSFTTTYEGVLSGLAPADYIRVAIDTTYYDDFNNGGVLANGALVSTKPLADGTYDIIQWSGEVASPPVDGTLVVSNGGTTATPTGIVFTVKVINTQVRTYQVESIRSAADGAFEIEAVHTPTNASGVLLLADGFDEPANWILET